MSDKRIQASYLTPVFDINNLRKVTSNLAKMLKPYLSEFDAIAFRGMSGALVAPNLALRLRKDLIMVRKPKTDESTHSGYRVEGRQDAVNYLIIDDLVGTGLTVKNIINEIKNFNPKSKCVGVLTYLEDWADYTDSIKYADSTLVNWNKKLKYGVE